MRWKGSWPRETVTLSGTTLFEVLKELEIRRIVIHFQVPPPYSAIEFPAFQSAMIGIEILQAYSPVRAYANVSFLIVRYAAMYSVRAAKNDKAALLSSLAGIFATLPATMAAANSGKTSIELMCAPRARARWFQSFAGIFDFQVSRLVRGLGDLISQRLQGGRLNSRCISHTLRSKFGLLLPSLDE